MRRLIGIGAALLALAAASLTAVVDAQQGTIRVTAPANGATVSGPVTVQVAIGGVPVKPAADGDLDAYHYHIFVDVDPATVTQPGLPIPTGQDNIIHTASLSQAIGSLPPGQHTVTVVLTKTNHVPLTPAIQDKVTFTVAAAGQTPPATGAPRTGTGLATSGAAAPAALAIVPAIIVAGWLVARRRARVR